MKAKFGRYVFLKKIAVGGMAEIFLARRLSFGGFAKFVVIKRLLPEHRGRKAYERLFLTEARTAAVLNHPHIVSLHDLGKIDDAYFMAMEYVHGMSGAELMAMAAHVRKPIPLGVALRVVSSVADALHYCVTTPDLDGSPMGVLHHDVSPHNVQLSFDGEVKLLDFGVATRMGRPAPGGRRGKFAYMSPEAMAREPLDPRSDLYSLGVVLFELSLGRRLFKGSTPDETKAQAEAREIPKPTEIDAYYPASLQEVVLKALSASPADRFESGQAFAHAVDDIARRLGLDNTAEATARYFRELYGEGIDRRRDELLALAEATTPRRRRKKGEDKATPAPESRPDQAIPEEGADQSAAASHEIAPPEPEAEAEAPPDTDAALEAASREVSPVPAVAEDEAEAQEAASAEAGGAEQDAAVTDEADAPAPPTPSPAPDLDEVEVNLDGLDADDDEDGGPSATTDTQPPEEGSLPPTYETPVAGADFVLPPGANDGDEPAWDTRIAERPPARWPWVAAALLAVAAFFGGRFIEAYQTPRTATLWIESEPKGARVYDGERLLGMTPFETPPAPVGKTYELRLTKPGHAEWNHRIELGPSGGKQSLHIALSRSDG